jgi:hypothetical protein
VGVSLVAGSRCPAPLFVLLISCAFFVVCLLGVVSCHNLHMSFYTGEPFFSRWQFPCVLFCMCLTCGRLSSRPHSVTLSRTLECPRSHLVGRRVVSNIVPGRFFFNKKVFHLFFFRFSNVAYNVLHKGRFTRGKWVDFAQLGLLFNSVIAQLIAHVASHTWHSSTFDLVFCLSRLPSLLCRASRWATCFSILTYGTFHLLCSPRGLAYIAFSVFSPCWRLSYQQLSLVDA